jgi:outer membrane lipase/esterase
MRLVPKICTSLLSKEKFFVSSPARSAALSIALILICTFAAAEAHPRDYKTIVVFGDSLSDTGNVADLTEVYGVRIPGPIVDYTDGRFTDGNDTQPPAQNYFGTWVEQFAASLPSHPQVKASLDGGTNYAYGFATTGSGTSPLTFGPSKLFPIQVDNIGQQITDYLATHPKIDNSTLFIIWGGAIDVLDATSPNDVINAAVRQTLNIQRLINAGATQFLVPNLPPLGLVPRLNQSSTTSVPANAASVLFNAWLATGISVLRDFYFYRRLSIYQLNVFALFNQIVSSPDSFSLEDIAHPSQGQPVDPDLYLFWDDLHPTTRGHNILANTASSLITKQLASQTR